MSLHDGVDGTPKMLDQGSSVALTGLNTQSIRTWSADRQMALPEWDHDIDEAMMENAARATDFLKALSHEGRLMILCQLASGEKSVTQLENLLSSRQAAVSQQLARLRLEGLVDHRRDGKAIYYRLKDPRAIRILEVLYEMFCKDAGNA